MEQQLIDKINKLCPENQGIFIEPFGCDGINEPLIYIRWVTGGIGGGGYHEDDYQRRYDGNGKPQFEVLNLVLKELKQNITFSQFKEIEELIISTEKDEFPDYYGNFEEYGIEYIKLSQLEAQINYFKTIENYD